MTHSDPKLGATTDDHGLTAWLDSLRLGPCLTSETLTVVPVYTRAAPARSPYQVLATALAAGTVSVTEAPRPTVPSVRVENRGAEAVLILDGEEIVGGQQNRIANLSVLVPPHAVVDLPVSCVEQFRWHAVSKHFGIGETAYPTLRRATLNQVSEAMKQHGARQADQGAIWAEISGRHRRDGAAPPTGAMRDLYARRQAGLERWVREIPCPAGDPVGIIAVLNGHAVSADIFDRTETLQAYWPRLIRSYVLEAETARERPVSAGTAERLIQRTGAAERRAYPSVGVGQDLRLSGHGIVGASLVWAAAVVHLAVFRRHSNEPRIHRHMAH